MKKQFDVIVVGGGHAGIEAAHAAAKMGVDTALLTLDPEKVASMPCNPSIGGLGKGHIVYEVSALGGLMPQLCSKTYLQARMLNTSKGPAVQGLRLQIDKYQYSQAAYRYLYTVQNLSIIKEMGVSLITTIDNGIKRVEGIITQTGLRLYAPTIVVTTGTFMSGLIHVGLTRYRGGRRGEDASIGLSESISQEIDMPIGRLKTGTPPRLRASSLDYTKFEKQSSHKLDYLFEFEPVDVHETVPCYLTNTTPKTHEIISSNLHLSAMYADNIKGIGPRYCPSIEDKIGRYPDRQSHHVFIEPEGDGVDEIYPAGLSTSLPLDVQTDYIRSIPGFEKAEITQCGYAIEYDYFQPTHLTHALESKRLDGLFLAGQINGTTGYEEAAGQGIIAGINAALKVTGNSPFTLNRNESYIGVMIDDLITLGANEPYRMFTSRAERRLLLRQDNVFARLMPHGYRLGLVPYTLYRKFLAEKKVVEKAVSLIKKMSSDSKLRSMLRAVEFTATLKQEADYLLRTLLEQHNISDEALSSRALLSIYAEIKYDGYLQKEAKEIEKMQRFQELIIPETMSFTGMAGLSRELQEKLEFHRPQTIAQAQLIQGMTPAAISILIFQIRNWEKENN
ncbi:MAG: tRNA uridine-5-carboxymethylaminomethyl(34) synthesis enzyme MnmG [Epsilonproteobacteria bacterium]|nr:tRNA uridine-5-carboxymethylaminomethyl(34) synthesis enzyme MnmG [Campylobacterota bacterium]